MRRKHYTIAMLNPEPQFIRSPSLFSIRTVVFVAITLLLHIWFLQANDWQHWTPERSPASQQMQVSLRQDAAKAAPTLPSAPKPVKKKHTVVATTPKTPEATKPKPESAPELAPEPILDSVPESVPEPTPEPVINNTETAPFAPPVTSPTTETGIVASNAYTALIPESVEMHMEVTHTKVNGSPTVGVGQLIWDVYNNQYQIKMQIGINLLFTTLNLLSISSEGSIGDTGLMPRTSTDARRNRAETAIHFDYAAGTITLSAGNKTVPLSTGAQDAASLLLQLAAIGNANPAQYRAGNSFAMQVAEGRDAAEFLFNVIGEEEIESKLSESGVLKVLHIVRPPRPGSYNSRLDIWLAPEKKWYPVQIRNTESNGNVTNQMVTAFKKKVVNDDK